MKFDLKYIREVLGVNAKILGEILEVPNLGRRKFLDSQDKKLSEITVAKLFALQETLEYAEDVFAGKENAAHWFHTINFALGMDSPLHMMSVEGVMGINNMRLVQNRLGQMKHNLYP